MYLFKTVHKTGSNETATKRGVNIHSFWVLYIYLIHKHRKKCSLVFVYIKCTTKLKTQESFEELHYLSGMNSLLFAIFRFGHFYKYWLFTSKWVRLEFFKFLAVIITNFFENLSCMSFFLLFLISWFQIWKWFCSVCTSFHAVWGIKFYPFTAK